MKRCAFSGTMIEEFRYTHNGSHICYHCHQRKKDHKETKKIRNTIEIEQLMQKAAATQIKKRKSKRNISHPKIKVDSRVIQMGIIPIEKIEPVDFHISPETEGLMWKIHKGHN